MRGQVPLAENRTGDIDILEFLWAVKYNKKIINMLVNCSDLVSVSDRERKCIGKWVFI